MKKDGEIKKRFTLLIYDNTGAFVKLRLFSASAVRLMGVLAVGTVLVIGFFIYNYIHLKRIHPGIHKLQKEIAALKDVIKGRDQQIASFRTKIDALELKLIKLAQLEQKIRSVAGGHPGMEDLSNYGIGGDFSEDPGLRIEEIQEPLTDDELIQSLNEAVDRLDKATLERSEEFNALWATLKEIEQIQNSTPSIRPIEGGWVSSRFGYRKDPFNGRQEFHAGLDLADRLGTPVKATADGTVTYTGSKGLLGDSVIIDHGFGISTTYGHLSKITVKAGQTVRRGQVIGRVGNSGRSTGPHLHYEVRLNNIPVNPANYMGYDLAARKPSS